MLLGLFSLSFDQSDTPANPFAVCFKGGYIKPVRPQWLLIGKSEVAPAKLYVFPEFPEQIYVELPRIAGKIMRVFSIVVT